MGLQVFDEHDLLEFVTLFQASDGTTGKSLATCSGSKQRIDHILVSSTSASAHDLKLGYNGDGTGPILTATIPANAGNAPGVPAIDLITLLPAGMDGWFMFVGDQLGVVLVVTLTGSEKISVLAFGGTL